MSTVSLPSPLLTSEQAAEILGTTPGNLSVWRCTRKVQIPFVKIGKSVRYRLADLEKFIESRTVGAEPAAPLAE